MSTDNSQAAIKENTDHVINHQKGVELSIMSFKMEIKIIMKLVHNIFGRHEHSWNYNIHARLTEDGKIKCLFLVT